MDPRIEIYGVEVDILLFVLIFDLLIYFLYAKVYAKNIKIMARQDIKVSLIGMLIIATNYFGTGRVVYIFGYEMSWFWYYLILDTVFSFAIFYFYMKYFKLSLKDLE